MIKEIREQTGVTTPSGWSADDILKDWKSYIDSAESGHRRAITTLESFGGDPDLLQAALQYAKSKDVDVMVAAESDGTFA